MADNKDNNPLSELRNRAEQQLSGEQEKGGGPGATAARNLIHELQVHQIELEMQNEELRRTQLALEASREKYVDLFEHAPVGYLLINDRGMIINANLTFCTLLGEPRFKLIGKPLSQWICKDYQDNYFLFRRRCLESRVQLGFSA